MLLRERCKFLEELFEDEGAVDGVLRSHFEDLCGSWFVGGRRQPVDIAGGVPTKFEPVLTRDHAAHARSSTQQEVYQCCTLVLVA